MGIDGIRALWSDPELVFRSLQSPRRHTCCTELPNLYFNYSATHEPVSMAMTATSPLTPSPSSLPAVPPSPATSSSSYHEPVTTVIDSDSDSDFEIVGSSSSNTRRKKPAKKVAGKANAGEAGKRKVESIGAGNARAGPSAGIKRQKTKTGKRANRANDGDHDDRDEDVPSASILNRPHPKSYHDTTSLAPLLPDLLAWFEEVREKRKMPWRKRYDDSASMEAKGQRAYEVRRPGCSGTC